MEALARSVNHDLFLFAGQLAMCDGKIAYAQIIEAAILTVKGELQFNVEQGIPYFDTIFLHPNKIALWKAYVIKRVKEFSFVLTVDKFEYDFDYKNHTVNYSMTVSTDEGIVRINSIDYSISTIGTHTSGGGDGGEQLIQNGIFYLPVFKKGNVQYYRQLKQYVDEQMGSVTTELSEETYVKNTGGVFILSEDNAQDNAQEE